MHIQNNWFDIGYVIKTQNLDIMIIAKKFIPETGKYLYLIPVPNTLSGNLMLVNEETLNTMLIEYHKGHKI